MTSSKIVLLRDIIKGDASRSSAIQAREQVLSLLEQIKTIEIDLTDVNFTPSVADELIGGLVLALGADTFKQKIKILNASESQMALMKHVIARRLTHQS